MLGKLRSQSNNLKRDVSYKRHRWLVYWTLRVRTEIEIFPHDELGAGRTHAQCRQVGCGDAQRVHICRQVPASLRIAHPTTFR